ncbi:alpha,alpha-trehalose-phosphate synthase (UDP-forming) [Parvularcula lutaonensis]|uniref:Trehalose-6-phosphate synthase n=1 Tax=Parvularcula lutaonensis TaxID=491923 RepID=A0ABV7MCL1_9PROT|nr:trehalose-6-phosphate synthase [Parvularcula lutaonensis]GGY49261.1 trehalose-6-phosphate synthase [Parvularcula lutaonensis]
MKRLVGVSNRTAAGGPKAGGLAVALWDALVQRKGLWFGWSGEVAGTARRGVELFEEEGVEFAVTDLTEAEHEGYYLGYANRALWPVLHYRVDLANFDEEQYDCYRDVNRRFAKLLYPRLREDDLVWIHDYHFFPMAQDLRDLGWTGRTGFFLHVPFPPPEIFKSVPDHRALAKGVCANDVIGFQTVSDRDNFAKYSVAELGAKQLDDEALSLDGRRIAIRAYPIGIDAVEFQKLSHSEEAKAAIERIEPFLGDSRALILGVDRMDYSKGIPNRFQAVGRLLDNAPELHGKIAYTQIAPPSRTKVEEYAELREQLDSLAGRINGDYGDLDWIPIRYLARSYNRDQLAGLYRIARVGLVTPLHDGMNLVAKEYVAAQDPEDPGVLVLSQFAGAAEQLKDGALLVNPHDTAGTADAIHEALTMPLAERKRRHEALAEVVFGQDIAWWREAFLADLDPSGNGSGSVVSLRG